jgi:hypothetical protein
MQWPNAAFTKELETARIPYLSDDGWFSGWKKDDAGWTEHVGHAWLMYLRANENLLGMLVLGDAKIRDTEDLLQNFGMTSGGLTDEKAVKDAMKIVEWRKGASPATAAVEDVAGKGSVLKDEHWTPMLNDAFILGGVHAGQDFHWAEETFHGQSGIDDMKAQKEGQPYIREIWRKYLLGQNNFWSNGFVRVFAREVIGLKAFGYKPIITAHEIGFTPNGGDPAKATFAAYREALTEVDNKSSNAVKINTALGEFLFGDRRALLDLKTGKKT